MTQRSIYTELEKHLPNRLVTVITGMRRVGKTTALKHLLSLVRHNNKIHLDLERIEYRHLFQQQNYADIERSLLAEGIDLKKKSVIAIDEIQLVPAITSVIKHLYDNYPVKFIVTGSSSFYIKNRFSESLAGRKRIFEMMPLDFYEFLIFRGETVKKLEQFAFEKINASFFNRYKEHYHDFVTYGGFPEVAKSENTRDRLEYLKDIINAYIELDIKLMSDFEAVDELYKLIRLLASRAGNKVDFTKLSGISGIHRKRIKEYLIFLEHTYFIRLISPFTKNIDREIAQQQKLYFTDSGILTVLGHHSTGALFENSIANQLAHHGKLNYYSLKTGNEIDFIIDGKIAIEVKESPSPSDLAYLKRIASSLSIKKQILVGKNFHNPKFSDFVWGGSIF
ncbi:MAG: ATP-binding protein [Chitinophagales bacterium]|nr:ATP-binding protein [Chitinophagaceae bacterium]MBP9881768.1 ATP-binding protein [Chitinophagales bacterium]